MPRMQMAGEYLLVLLFLHPSHRCCILAYDAFHKCALWYRYHVHGIFILNADQAGADYAKVYFDGASTVRDVVVDNLQVKVVPQNCKSLIMNPSFDEGSAFWSYIDRGYSKVSLYPGEDGDSDFALRSYARTSSRWRGVRQRLDTRCFVSGSEYTITAKFRLLNASSQGMTCNTNIQYDNDQMCPNVVIYGWGCQGGDV